MVLVTTEVIWLWWLLEDFYVSMSMPTLFCVTVHMLSILLVIW
jgi:hypothetical protein